MREGPTYPLCGAFPTPIHENSMAEMHETFYFFPRFYN